MIVVDTSVLVDFLAGRKTAAARKFARLERDEIPYAIPVICCQELLQGARDKREWDLLEDYLGSQRLVSSTDEWTTHLEAARIFFDCRRRGITVRSAVDCWIAQLVLDNEGTLLHDDVDFERIRRVRPLRTL